MAFHVRTSCDELSSGENLHPKSRLRKSQFHLRVSCVTHIDLHSHASDVRLSSASSSHRLPEVDALVNVRLFLNSFLLLLQPWLEKVRVRR